MSPCEMKNPHQDCPEANTLFNTEYLLHLKKKSPLQVKKHSEKAAAVRELTGKGCISRVLVSRPPLRESMLFLLTCAIGILNKVRDAHIESEICS